MLRKIGRESHWGMGQTRGNKVHCEEINRNSRVGVGWGSLGMRGGEKTVCVCVCVCSREGTEDSRDGHPQWGSGQRTLSDPSIVECYNQMMKQTDGGWQGQVSRWE